MSVSIAKQMKSILVFALSVLLLPVSSSTTDANPINKVLEMVSSLQGKIIQEGAEEQKMYAEFAHMCQGRSRDLHHEQKTTKAKVAESSANIEKNKADATLLEEKISDTAAAIDDSENEIKKAAEIRKKEAADYKSEEKSLLTMISAVERSITIIERGSGEGGAALAQVQQDNMQSIASVFEAMVEASGFDSYDQEKLSALVQTANNDKASDEEDETGAPSAAAYKSSSGGIVETLGGMLEKAQKNLDDSRQAESTSSHQFDMQKQSLNDKVKTLKEELGEAKKDLAAAGERKANSEGDLEMSQKDLAEGEKELEELHHECLDKANSFEESQTSRNEELKALAEAKKIITESTGGASKQTYDFAQASFLQVAAKSASSSSQSVLALHVVRHLALSHHSEGLGKLAAMIEQTIRQSNLHGADPFAKVKNLLTGMVEQLERKAAAAATKKDYCDKAMAETEASKENKEDSIEKLTIQIDVMSADSKKLKADVLRLDKELQELSGNQAEMDKLRVEEKSIYAKNKPEMQQGLEGIQSALKVLREYYAQDDAGGGGSASGGGAASGIIGMLEVVESDFDKGIAAMTAEEEGAQSEYVKATNENQVAQKTKEQDRKFKTAEFVSLDKSVVDLKTDRTGSREELAAVQQYFAGIKKDCVARVDSYDERKKRRDEEIAGLKEAMSSLKEEPSFLQQGMVQKSLRGVHRHW